MKVIRRPVKHARIELRDGEVVVIAPRGVDPEKIIERKKEWIERNLRRIDEVKDKARRDVNTKGVKILDKAYRIRRDCKDAGIRGNEIHICKKKSSVLREELREMLREDMRKRAEKYAKTLRVKTNRIYIREQKTKWGSCSPSNNLNFNLRLVFLPADFRDYIAAHEVTHLIHRNHGREFKSTLKNLGIKLPSREELMYYWYYAEACKEKLML